MHLAQLGIANITAWRHVTSFRNGLVLIIGPEDSGKTTTLNATIRGLRGLEKSIYTFADPTGWRPPHLGHVQTRSRVPLDFASGIHAFMRGDPDVIILDGIRDPVAAKKAIRAAENGHLVIATIEAESVHMALQDLLALGAELEDFEMLLRGVLFQLLVRALCSSCGGTGCELCFGDGYDGRTVVSDIALVRTPADVGRMTRPDLDDIYWNGIRQDLKAKIRSGVTDLREMHRCLRFGRSTQLPGERLRTV